VLVPEYLKVSQELVEFFIGLKDIDTQLVNRGDRPHALTPCLLV
jgi:hypothetical protein